MIMIMDVIKMKKIMMIDEMHRVSESITFTRIHVTYNCGCAVYNDAWKTKLDAEELCVKHSKNIRAVMSEKTYGKQPVESENKQSFFKIYRN